MIHEFIDQLGERYGVCFVEGKCVGFFADNWWIGERGMADGKILWVEDDLLYQKDFKEYCN